MANPRAPDTLYSRVKKRTYRVVNYVYEDTRGYKRYIQKDTQKDTSTYTRRTTKYGVETCIYVFTRKLTFPYRVGSVGKSYR